MPPKVAEGFLNPAQTEVELLKWESDHRKYSISKEGKRGQTLVLRVGSEPTTHGHRR